MRPSDATNNVSPLCLACASEPVCGLFDRCEPVSKRGAEAPANAAGGSPVRDGAGR